MKRNGAFPTGMDSLQYFYYPDKNQLAYVNDSVPATNYGTDIDDQSPGNYTYDLIGNLSSDASEEIQQIKWTVYGKVKKIKRTGGSTKPELSFEYDALNNRVRKTVKDSTNKTFETYYVRDVQGNILATYRLEKTGGPPKLFLDEQTIYGSSRIGVIKRNKQLSRSLGGGTPVPGPGPINPGGGNQLGGGGGVMGGPVITPAPKPVTNHYVYHCGKKRYELNSWIGNVMAVVSDKQLPVDTNNDGFTDFFNAHLVAANDFMPFGSVMPGRSFNANLYRYGFNGQEKTDEISGNGNHYTAEFWEYDPRTVRRWNNDPVTMPWQSTYAAFNNNPIFFKDPSGAQAEGPGDPPTDPQTGKPFKSSLPSGGTADIFANRPPGFFKRAGSAIGGFFSSIKSSIGNILRRGDEAGTGDAPYIIPGGLPQHSEFGQVFDIMSFSLNPQDLGPSRNIDLIVATRPGAGPFQFGQGPLAIATGIKRGTDVVKEAKSALKNSNADDNKAQSEANARRAMHRDPNPEEYIKAGLIHSDKLYYQNLYEKGILKATFIDAVTGDTVVYPESDRIVAERLGWNKLLKTK